MQRQCYYLHPIANKIKYIPHILGHSAKLEISFPVPRPSQAFPPLDGAGLVHVRSRVLVAFPQLTDQAPQSCQVDQFPSTITKKIIQ